MGIFDFFRKPKTELEEYYEQRSIREQMEMANGDFQLAVQDVFTITGRGTVVVGLISSGSVRVGDMLELERINGITRMVKVGGLESFRKLLNEAYAGQKVGILLEDIDKNDISKGDRLRKGQSY